MVTDVPGLLREVLHRPAVIHRPGCAEGDLLDRLTRDDSFMECSCGGTSQFHAILAIEAEAATEARRDLLAALRTGVETYQRTKASTFVGHYDRIFDEVFRLLDSASPSPAKEATDDR